MKRAFVFLLWNGSVDTRSIEAIGFPIALRMSRAFPFSVAGERLSRNFFRFRPYDIPKVETALNQVVGMVRGAGFEPASGRKDDK